ncbi:hypothetical protein TRICI_006018 [Trichomonascus ciferrii]|uniref:DUF3445 domain-containing protein n=1 Tax=Trichomonascus ciferrii TaxID=44093 RepID=A0A642UTU6_9ASCO|nr:hypothetical protein TRICI_006018 [Trichomonascus ciferrii]
MLLVYNVSAILLVLVFYRWLKKREFDWRAAEPQVYRPFVGKGGDYRLTMGVRSLADDDPWLRIENTYLQRTEAKQRIMEQHRQNTVLHNEIANDALRETYDVVMAYMLRRYPTCFRQTGSGKIMNTIRHCALPADATGFDKVEDLVMTLGRNVEEDLLVLMKNDADGLYYLRGGTFGFPSGFDPAEKLNKPLAHIHAPVPGYKERLEKPMDVYFDRIRPGRWVERFNWNIQPHDELYVPEANHADQDDQLDELKMEDLDFSRVYLRVERQCLTRLPNTQAVLFSIRTHLTPLTQLVREQCIHDLIPAIDALPPAMAQYKRRPAWGNAVKQWICSNA